MISKIFSGVERFVSDWLTEALVVAVIALAVKLTAWSAQYADTALVAKADLMGVAAVIAAVAAAPLGILTLLLNKYSEIRKADV